MLEIIIIIAVVKAFASQAESKNRSQYVWGTIGALSYYVPVLSMGFVLFPILVQAGLLPFVTQDNVMLVNIGFNLAAGIACCGVAYLFLSNLSDTEEYAPANYGGADYGRKKLVDPGNPYSS